MTTTINTKILHTIQDSAFRRLSAKQPMIDTRFHLR
jgi:hypothetical protein